MDAGDQGVKDDVDERINDIRIADTLLDSLRGAEYEVRYTNATPSEGSSLVCIGARQKNNRKFSSYVHLYSFNRPKMHHASGDGWTHNFLDRFLSLVSLVLGTKNLPGISSGILH